MYTTSLYDVLLKTPLSRMNTRYGYDVLLKTLPYVVFVSGQNFFGRITKYSSVGLVLSRRIPADTMARWHNVLHGCGRFVVFTNDHQLQNVCRLNNIPTICVQHTNEGVPRTDQIFKRMHASGSRRSSVGSDTVVAFINSDLV